MCRSGLGRLSLDVSVSGRFSPGVQEQTWGNDTGHHGHSRCGSGTYSGGGRRAESDHASREFDERGERTESDPLAPDAGSEKGANDGWVELGSGVVDEFLSCLHR